MIVIAFGVSIPTLVVKVIPGSPAEHAGIVSGDRIVAIDGETVHTWDEVLAALRRKPAQTVRVAVDRASEDVVVVATTNERGRLGFESWPERARPAFGFAVLYALTRPAQMVMDIFVGWWEMLIGSRAVEIAGISDLGRLGSKGDPGQAPWFLLAMRTAYLWPGVWLLEATHWWATRAKPIMSPPLKLASRWRRLLATAIDASLLGTVTLIGGVVAVPMSKTDAALNAATLLVALAWLMVQWQLVWKTGQSFGKQWMKIRIVREDAAPVGFIRIILVRSWIVPLVGLLGPLGGVILYSDPIAIWRRDRRCIHDIWAGTIVVDS